MEAWTDFFVAEVGAAAALAGLLVVAISINIAKIMGFPLLPGRAAQTLIIIGGALLIASFALFPHQPLAVFGAESLVVGFAVGSSGAFQLRAARHQLAEGNPLTWTMVPLGMVAVSALPEIIGGALLIAGQETGLYWIGTGIILSFVATLQNGWVLLIEILR